MEPKLSPLMNGDRFKKLVDEHGLEAALGMTDRGTGRTTRIALGAVVAALNNPGTRISVRDHATAPYAAQELEATARGIVVKLALNYVEVTRIADQVFVRFGRP